MNTTVVHYNAKDYAGRAIEHLLEKSALADIQHGLEVRSHTDGGRTLIVHPSFDSWASDGERTLMVAVESLAGAGFVNLRWLLDGLDERSKRAFAEAVLIAGGFRGATYLQVS